VKRPHETGTMWKEPEAIPSGQPALSDDPLLNALLYRRGLRTRIEAEAFLNERPSPAPSPSRIPNLSAAIDRIERALDSGERIAVFGDYDVDGITSAAILTSSLRAMTTPELVSVRLPLRSEGYGLSMGAVDEIAGAGANLLVTVDCGSNDHEAIARAKALGLDVVVFDHHSLNGAPPEGAIVASAQLGNTNGLKDLSAAGVAFLAVTELSRRGRTLPFGGDVALLDLVALGLIGDVMPLLGVSRALVRDGLRQLRRAERPGVRALFRIAELMPSTVTAEDVSFKLTPRLNAAGRLSDPALAFDLLMAPDVTTANRLATELEELNRRRRDQSKIVLDDVEEMIRRDPDRLNEPILIFDSAQWPSGVLGAAASKLCERFSRPVVMLAVEGDFVHGSARSAPGFDIAHALAQHSHLLERHGGHAQAAGLTLRHERLEELSQALAKSAPPGDLEGVVYEIEADLDVSRLTLTTARLIDQLQPFGNKNPKPLLRIRGLRAQKAEVIGKDRSHLRVMLSDGNRTTKAVMFGAAGRQGELRPGTAVDVLAQLKVDSWNGADRLDIEIKDFRPAED
jgi:single-stranded-DNA-specific exonuclease